MKIIVNADDWGLEHIRDKAIVECFRRGWLTNTTAVMNRPGLERATEFAHAEGFADRVGLHVNLTYGCPLTDAIRRQAFFCDSEGCFTGAFHRHAKSRLWLPSEARRAVADEVRAQARCYKEQGYAMMHADSHHHSHTDLAIATVIVEVLKSEGFRTLRISRNIGAGLGGLKSVYKKLFNGHVRRKGMAFSDYFGSLEDFAVSIDSIPCSATVELMCHPMFTIGHEDREDGDLTDLYHPFDEALMNRIVKMRGL